MNSSLLIKTLQDYLKTQALLLKKSGCIVYFDGTLMSLVNVLLIKDLVNFNNKYVACITNNNKIYVTHLLSLAKHLKIDLKLLDISKDLETSSLFSSHRVNHKQELATRKRFVDLTLNLEADSGNQIVLGNLSYSQWCIEYPHKVYLNLEHVHLLNRLFYSEVKELAKFYDLPETIINRAPSHFISHGKTDKDVLDFTYEELEEYLRSAKSNQSNQDQLISKLIQSDNRNRFMCPLITRPSNILS
jgi:NAD+ synthase